MADQFTTVNEAIRNHLKARYPLIGLSSTDGLRLPLGKVGGRRIWLRLGLRGGERAFLRAIVTGPGRAHLQARSAVDAGGRRCTAALLEAIRPLLVTYVPGANAVLDATDAPR